MPKMYDCAMQETCPPPPKTMTKEEERKFLENVLRQHEERIEKIDSMLKGDYINGAMLVRERHSLTLEIKEVKKRLNNL